LLEVYKSVSLKNVMAYGKSAFLAALLNFFVWGAGYLYIGHRMLLGAGLTAISILNMTILLSLPESVLMMGSELFSMWLSFIWIALGLLFAEDVYRETNEMNKVE